jgi:tight adherence protein C
MTGLEIAILAALFSTVLAGAAGAGYVFVIAPSTERRDPLDERKQGIARALQLIGEAVPPPEIRIDPVRKRLIAAGYRWPAALSIYTGISYAMALLLALVAAWWSFLSQENWFAMLLAAVSAGALGFMLPDRILYWKVRERSSRIREGLPVALDLLVLGVEAGQTLDVALGDTSRELRFAFPELSRELGTVSLELRSPTEREQVFRDLGTRNAEPDLRKISTLFIDADRFGTSLGPALRTHARYLRTRRRQLAQEHARKIGVKLIFPVFFLIFPCVLLVTVGPAVLHILTSLREMAR